MLEKCYVKLYDTIIAILIGSAVLFTALAWRDYGIEWIDRNPHVKNGGPLVYAIIVSVITVIVVIFLMFPFKWLICGTTEVY